MKLLVFLLIGVAAVGYAQPGRFRQFPGGGGPGRGGGAGDAGRVGSPQGQAQAEAQPVPPEDLCTVEGRVTNLATGEPLTKTTLLMVRAGGGGGGGRRQPYSASTDAEGRFKLKDIEPGSYQFSATRNGFVRQEYGAKQTGRRGKPLVLNKGQQVADIQFSLVRQAVITGRIQDEDGEPLSRVQVNALRSTWSQGRRQLTPAGFAQTDDRGIYRIHDLPPGKYLLSATHPGISGIGFTQNRSAIEIPEETYSTTYYPGGTDPSAAAKIEVTAGGEAPGVDLRLAKRPAVSVRGRVENQTNGRMEQIFVMIAPRSQASFLGGDRRPARVDSKGNFEIRGVAPGSYVISANLFRGQTRAGGHLPIEVGHAPVDGIVLTVAPGLEVKGISKVEGDAALPSGVSVSLTHREMPLAMPLMGNLNTRLGDGGVFSFESVLPDVYDVRVRGLTGGFYLKTVKYGPEQALESGVNLTAGASGSLELLFSPNGAAVEGTVTRDGKAMPGATVALAPEAVRSNRPDLYRTAVSGDGGHYSFDSLPPGKYRLYAFEDLEEGAGQDPEFLKEFENAAEKVELEEKAALTKPLTLIAVEGRGGAQ